MTVSLVALEKIGGITVQESKVGAYMVAAGGRGAHLCDITP